MAAASLAARLSLTTEEALRAISVQRQVRALRLGGGAAAAAVELLTSRLQGRAAAVLEEAEQPAAPAHSPAGSLPGAAACQAAVSTAFAVRPVAVLHAASSSPHTSPRQTAHAPPGSLKRSRSSGGGGAGGAPSTKDAVAVPAALPALSAEQAEVERALAAQLSGLAVEINEAMRAGDRAKVAGLMRRRDQLRAAGKAAAAAATAGKGAAPLGGTGGVDGGSGGASNKRARQQAGIGRT